jgi:hypothetical protein
MHRLQTHRWPWDKYRSGLEQPHGGPQRTFLVLVLQHMVRLTSWTNELLLQVWLRDGSVGWAC